MVFVADACSLCAYIAGGQIQIGSLISQRDERELNLHARLTADSMLSTHYLLDNNDKFA